MSVVALSRGGAHGVLVIAGIPLSAQLPEAIGAKGETLRLSVSEVTPERGDVQLDQTAPRRGARGGRRAARREARVRVEVPPRTVQVEGEERSTVALGQEVPEELWGAVAAALAWAYSVGDSAIPGMS